MTETALDEKTHFYIDLGEVKHIARVYHNDHDFGIVHDTVTRKNYIRIIKG